MPRYVKNIDIFWSLVEKTDAGCWNWRGSVRKSDGYGRLNVNGRETAAHRYAYELTNGPIAPGLDLDHLCRNRRCVRPSHLDPVPRRVNVRRGAGTTIANGGLQATCKNGHPATPENRSAKTRRCLECDREKHRRPEYKARHAELSRRAYHTRKAARVPESH